jgi:hypothetical protein
METVIYPHVKRTVINDLSSFVQRVSPPPVAPPDRSRTEFGTDVLRRMVGYRKGISILYRGQSDSSWELSPKIDRPVFRRYRDFKSITREKQEILLLDVFMSFARSHLSILPQNRWEWLALAQHHGLATRLLDWSAKALSGNNLNVQFFGSIV